MTTKKLHVISTGRQRPELLASIIGKIHRDIDFIHLREKTKTAKEIYELVELLLEKKVPLAKIIINDRADIAHVSKARGVHLANHSLPVKIVKQSFKELTVGRSVHSIEEARMAEQQGVNYIVYGHIYSTASKPGLLPKGLELLKSVAESVSVPVVAIGGITPIDGKEVIEAGAQGVAVMSGILEAEDPVEAAREYRSFLTNSSSCI